MINGAAVWTVSLSALSLSRIYLVFTLIYMRLIEEQELEECFGLEFLDHKRGTSFLLTRSRD
jgi:hypothetical protein